MVFVFIHAIQWKVNGRMLKRFVKVCAENVDNNDVLFVKISYFLEQLTPYIYVVMYTAVQKENGGHFQL